MPTHSNIAFSTNRGAISRLLVVPLRVAAANDNGAGKSTDPAIVEAALRHFAGHGLGAAGAARHKAEQAFFANNQPEYRWWLEICRQLDRRMAVIAARELNA
jgi:hypothetical protein